MEQFVESSATLSAVYDTLSAEHQAVLQEIVHSYRDGSSAKQLFNAWDADVKSKELSRDDVAAKVRGFCDSILAFNKSYAGGVKSYLSKAQVLLKQSKEQYNPLIAEWTPTTPKGNVVDFGAQDPQFERLESIGREAVRNAAFVLVAGGRGERLGYDGIKVSLPVQILTQTCYLQHFVEHILAFQQGGSPIPLAIMTSADTHADTVRLLEANNNFGASDGQITLMQQDLVPSLMNNEGLLATAPGDPFCLSMKPHGHGDVHALLHSRGLAQKWSDEGRTHVIFFQDTQALFVKVVIAALGYAVEQELAMSTVTVPRKAGDAVGALVRLQNKVDASRTITANVEYNQLGGLLQANGKTDSNDPATGFSPFPGNTNQLILRMKPYLETLRETNGVVAEFVNPKYADAERTTFKKATRLECMMQDIALALPRGAAIGFTTLPPVTYSPVKNDIDSAIANVAKGKTAACAITGEVDVYRANCTLLQGLGVNTGSSSQVWPTARWLWDLEVSMPPKVLWDPSFAFTTSDLRRHFPHPEAVSISSRSTLLLTGDCSGIVFNQLELDGTLVVRGAPGVKVEFNNAIVANEGLWTFEALERKDLDSYPTYLKMRGFKLERTPGAFVVDCTKTMSRQVIELTGVLSE